KAEIFDYILNNWSMVRIGSGANQKKIFFGLSRAKRALGIMDNNLSDVQLKQLSEHLNIPESDIETMAVRMHARDLSLNAPVGDDSDAPDMLSNLPDITDGIEDRMEQLEFRRLGAELLKKHLAAMPDRDREILVARRLSDPVLTLEQLSEKYKISRERVRQIEEKAFAKLQSAILAESKEQRAKSKNIL
ncbi:MAG: RNA polymerase factor sigma-32, partial [Alphaproteobacteria bacterium]|nr:RNA polymerase factor sigma-32 [Alphaproteobacteria bacterium]